MVAGSFAHMDGIPRNNIARLNLDGSLDETFNPGSGADNTIYAVVETLLAPTTNNQAPIPAYHHRRRFREFQQRAAERRRPADQRGPGGCEF